MPVSPREPAYTRLAVDERRRRLLELGTELFTNYTYDELSMAKIAKEAGISKALLYHYFPSKQAYFVETLQTAAAELEAILGTATPAPDPDRPAAEQLIGSVNLFLTWIEENSTAYLKLIHSSREVPEVREVVDGVRQDTATRILTGLNPDGEPSAPLRAAVRAWLWFMDGACLDWVEHKDISKDQLAGLLLGTLMGAITAAGEGHVLARLAGGAEPAPA